MFDGKVQINLGSCQLSHELFYTPEEYAEHMKSISALMSSNPRFHYYVLAEAPFSGVQIVRQGNYVQVIRQKNPYAAFVFTHAYMLRAFDDYFDTFRARCSESRSEVKRTLLRYV